MPNELAPGTAVQPPWGVDSGLWHTHVPVGVGARVCGHAPSSLEALEDLLWNVDELQARADQPMLHELSARDWYPPSREQRAQMSAARRKRQTVVADAEPSDYKGYGLTNDGGCPMHPCSSAAVFLPVLKSIAAGAGASILRVGSSPRMRGLLRQRTPHDLALLATGVSLSLGVRPMLSEHCVHVMQSGVQGEADSAWPVWQARESPPDVNLVACIQHGGRGDDSTGSPVDEKAECGEDAEYGHPIVWLTSVQDLFDEVRQHNAEAAEVRVPSVCALSCRCVWNLANRIERVPSLVHMLVWLQLLTQPHYVYRIDAPDHDDGDDDDEEDEDDDYARFLVDDEEQQQSDTQNNADSWAARVTYTRGDGKVQHLGWNPHEGLQDPGDTYSVSCKCKPPEC